MVVNQAKRKDTIKEREWTAHETRNGNKKYFNIFYILRCGSGSHFLDTP
jgi:hypothetical protein